jgi:hypothetical protein
MEKFEFNIEIKDLRMFLILFEVNEIFEVENLNYIINMIEIISRLSKKL